MFWLWWLLILPLGLYLALELHFYKYKRAMNRIQGPWALPIIGNAHQMGKNPVEILSNIMLWWKQFNGKSFRVWIGGYFAYIFITEPEDLEHILTSNTMIEKSDIYDMLHPWLGRGLLTSTGPHWFKRRKVITPSFHFNILKVYHEVMKNNTMRFMKKLRQMSAGDSIFDFQKAAHYYSLDVICETAMGISINAMDEHDSEVVKAYEAMCYNINMRIYHPWKRKNNFYRWFASDYPAYVKTLNILKDFTNEVISKRIEERQQLHSKQLNEEQTELYVSRKKAFLDTLLTETIDGKPLTQEDIYEEVSTFVFEGHDTTTSGIAFSIFLLSRHPSIQQKVYEEQLNVMQGKNKGAATFTQLADMKYLDLVIKETQRIYPSVPMVSRYCDKDQIINGKFVPEYAVMNLLIFCMGYNEKYFPDPYRVDPLRFDADKNTEKLHTYAYLPFSAGPRNCIGQKFALLELKSVISSIVRNFEILPPLDELVSKNGYIDTGLGLTPEQQLKLNPNPSKYDPQLSMVITLKSENGIQIRLRERA